MELTDRHVLVTGASRGLGEVIAHRFAAAGARLSLVARNADALARVAAETNGSVHSCDLADPGAVPPLLAAVESAHGAVDVLVNNAGVDTPGWLPGTDPAALQVIYQLNLVTPALLCRAVLPAMIERGAGHVVNVSSLAGTSVFPGLAAYSSTKAGLSHFTAGLRADLRGLPIGTTLVELGPVPTDMIASAMAYGPTGRSFDRMYRLQILVDTDPNTIADDIVRAVRTG